MTRPLDVADAGFAAVRDIVTRATLAIANLNINILEEAPAASGPDAPPWPFARPRDAEALRELGVDVVSLANDHATDFGADGLASTRRALSRAGVLDVGAGPDLAAARRPVFIGRASDGRARVAVVALAASSTSASRATASRADILGRAGLNPLRYAPDVTADPKTFRTLSETAEALGGGQVGDSLSLFGTTIKRGERTAIQFLVDPRDEREILETVAAARRDAEFVVVSIHSHEPANASAEPAEFLRLFARRAIDAGAHAIVGHGPHRLRGVEAYRGGIILYSVGDFVYQLDEGARSASEFDSGADLYALAIGAGASPVSRLGSPGGTASIVALLDFFEGRLARVRLEPIGLDPLGMPRLAAGDERAEIFGTLQALAGPATIVGGTGSASEVVLK